jgi:hypothetical protein
MKGSQKFASTSRVALDEFGGLEAVMGNIAPSAARDADFGE